MEELKYIVGSKIYRLSEKSFKYQPPDFVTSLVTAYGTDMFEELLNRVGMPQEFYDHSIWSNFTNSTAVVRDLISVGTDIAYKFSQSPADNYTTYTLQLWPSQEAFDTTVAENLVAYENLRSARTSFLSKLGLEMEIRRSYKVINPIAVLSYDEIKSIFENL
jgi:hypothetical protein